MQDFHAQPREGTVAELGIEARAAFILRTYLHLFVAMAAFTLVEVALFRSGIAERIAQTMLGTNWLLVIGGFLLVSWIASRAAHSALSPAVQYLALAAFVLAEAIVFVPLLWIGFQSAPGAVESAALVTLTGFAGLTFIAFWSRMDFSFLGSLLRWVGFGAILAIIAGLIFGFSLGTWFSVGMVVFAGAAILYDTSNVLHRFPEDRHVGAALELFASVALLFWYVLRIFIQSRD